MEFSDFAESSLDVRSGELVLKGTRVPLAQIFAEIASGYTICEIAEDLELDLDMVRGAVKTIVVEIVQLRTVAYAAAAWRSSEIHRGVCMPRVRQDHIDEANEVVEAKLRELRSSVDGYHKQRGE